MKSRRSEARKAETRSFVESDAWAGLPLPEGIVTSALWNAAVVCSGVRSHTAPELLDKAGVKHVYFEAPGTAHEFETWRKSLHGFAPLLFQK